MSLNATDRSESSGRVRSNNPKSPPFTPTEQQAKPTYTRTETENLQLKRKTEKNERRRQRRKTETGVKHANVKTKDTHKLSCFITQSNTSYLENYSESEEEYEPLADIITSSIPRVSSVAREVENGTLSQQSYYLKLKPLELDHEDDRPMFSSSRPHIRAGVLKLQQPMNIKSINVCACVICRDSDHFAKSCPTLQCLHCGVYGAHFSHACPTHSDTVKSDWHTVRNQYQGSKESIPLALKVFCYYCASACHYGDDCPLIQAPEETGSFSIAEIELRKYASNSDMDLLKSHVRAIQNVDGRRQFMQTGTVAVAGGFELPFDPFEDYNESVGRSLPSDAKLYEVRTSNSSTSSGRDCRRQMKPGGGGHDSTNHVITDRHYSANQGISDRKTESRSSSHAGKNAWKQFIR